MGVIQNAINQGLAMASVLGQMQGVPEIRKIKKGEEKLSEAYSKAMSDYDNIQQKAQSNSNPLVEKALKEKQEILDTISGERVDLAKKRRELTHDYGDYEKEQTERIRQNFTSNIMNYQKEYADFANSLASLQKQQANEQKMQVKKHKFDKDIIGGMYE